MDWNRLGPGITRNVRDSFTELRNYVAPKGEIFYVDKGTGTSGDGKSWGNAFLTITEGIAALTDGDTLIIGAGNYDEAATITLSGLTDVRILGMSTGMQWGEGSTNWRSVTSEDDLLDITGCKAVEIAGIGFIVPTDDMDAINFTGLNYSTHIHDCCFVGDCGSGAVMAYGVNIAGSNGPDTYIHDCKFFRVKTAAIIMGHQRNTISHNIFIVPNSGIGISGLGSTAAYNIISDNYFLGGATGDYGIYSASDTAGLTMIVNNMFANFDQTGEGEICVSKDANVVHNFTAVAASGGADAQPDPEA